ncbi:MAG: DUF4412 domain-containing protein [Deltaproteobacteria bacterium]|nr:DUF4412 domain-containing protein [Deltaproteobacteria bacterium]
MNVIIIAALALVSAHRFEQKISMSGPPTAAMQQQPDQKSVMIWDGPRMRTDQGSESSSIVDFKTDSMIMLDHQKKQYVEMKVSQMLAQAQAMLAHMKAQASALPPEQKSQYEEMLRQQTAPLSVVATEETQKILGFDAKKFVLKQGEKTLGDVWYTKAIDMSDLAPFTKQFAEMMRGATGSNWGDILTKTEHGYPLRTAISIDLGGKRATYTTETTKYEKVPTDSKDFSAPAGYKKVDPNAAQQPGKTLADPGGATPAKRSTDAPREPAKDAPKK